MSLCMILHCQVYLLSCNCISESDSALYLFLLAHCHYKGHTFFLTILKLVQQLRILLVHDLALKQQQKCITTYFRVKGRHCTCATSPMQTASEVPQKIFSCTCIVH